MDVARSSVLVALLIVSAGCAGGRPASPAPVFAPHVLFETRPPSWFEHLTDAAVVSVDGTVLFYGTGSRRQAIDSSSGAALDATTAARPDPVRAAASNGRMVATIDPADRAAGVTVDGLNVPVPGAVLAIQWTPDGASLVTLSRRSDDTLDLGVITGPAPTAPWPAASTATSSQPSSR